MTVTDASVPPAAAPPVVDRAAFDAALAEQVAAEKEVTRHNDRVSASRRRLPMVECPDYEFTGPDGPVRLSALFGRHHVLCLQNVMYAPDWDEGCPSCTWGVDNLPDNMGRLDDEGIAFAMASEAPIEKLETWRERNGWDHTWVSSGGTTYDADWGWTVTTDSGWTGPQPGYTYLLLRDGVPYVTYLTRARGTEAIMPTAAIMDRTVYGRRQDWEDSPAGWPQAPTYG